MLNLTAKLKLFSTFASLWCMFIGLIVLLGWQTKVAVIKSIFPGWPSMVPATAFSFLLAGLSLWLQIIKANNKKAIDIKEIQTNNNINLSVLISKICALTVTAISFFTILNYLFPNMMSNANFPIISRILSPVLSNKMSPATAMNFIFIGAALLLINKETRKGFRYSEILVLIVLLMTIPLLLAYIFNAEFVSYGFGTFYKTMALHTAVSFLVLSFGLLWVYPDRGLMAILTFEGPGGITARRLLPAAFVIPPLIAFIRLKGEKAGFYNTEFGLALFAMSNIAIFAIMIWINTYHIHKIYLKHKASEEMEKVQSKVLETLIEFAPDAFVFTKGDGKIVLVNEQTEKYFGYHRDELLGQLVEVLIPERFKDIHARHRADYMSCLKSRPMGTRMDIYGKRKDGTEFPIDVSLSPVKTHDGVLVACIIRDITERKKFEETLLSQKAELERSNAELERFAYVASHDLQEPLRMVTGYTQLIAKRYKGKLDTDADEFIQYAVDGAVRMQRLINDLLAYSRLGSKGQQFEKVDTIAALQEALSNLEVTIKENNADITYDPLPLIIADKLQIVQLFQNLISNPIKFKGCDPPKIHVSATFNNNEWLFSIKDNGIGFEPKYLDRIFVIFQRLHSPGEYPGTGIGLAICKKILEHHGGRIWAESQVGSGATFYFTIPASKNTPDKDVIHNKDAILK